MVPTNRAITVSINSDLLNRIDAYVESGGRSGFLSVWAEVGLAIEPLVRSWEPETIIARLREALELGDNYHPAR